MNKLTTPQLVDLVRQHHPDIPITTIIHKLNTKQDEYCRRTKNNVYVVKIDLDGQTVVGETESSPLNLFDTGFVSLWQFYKDGTVPTVALKKNVAVMYYIGFDEMDSGGDEVRKYAFTFNEDGSVFLWDEQGDALDDFQGDTDYLRIRFTKKPTNLVASAYSLPEIDGEFHDGLASAVIGDLYPMRKDMAVQERLMMGRHYKNVWEESIIRGKKAFNMVYTDIPVSAQASAEFEED